MTAPPASATHPNRIATLRFALVLWAAAAVALSLAALVFHAPGFMDAYYYYHVAANLAAGRGLTEDVVWNYLTNAPAVTHPSNLYWMPLTSFAVAPFLALFGEGFRAAQVPMVALAAMAIAATGGLMLRHTGSRFKAAIAAGLALFCGYYFVYWVAVDSFGLFALAALGVFVAGAGLAEAHSPRSAARWGAVLGVAAGMAHLARADGPLLPAATLLALAPQLRRAPAPRTLAGLLAAAAAYLLVMGPWFARNLAVSGSPLPSGGLSTVFLTEYNEIFSYQQPLDPAHYLAEGWGPVLAGKGAALARNLGVLFGLEYWLIPFAVLGAWRWRGWLPMRAALVYGVLLYLAMSLVFTYPSGRGSMLHSGVALVPWLAMAAVEGVQVAVRWVAARLPHWNPPVAFRNFSLIFLLLSASMCVYLTGEQARDWEKQVTGYRALLPLLPEPGATVMALNPPGWWWVARTPSIQAPSNGPAAALAAAARYGATYLVLEPARAKAWEGFDPQNAGPHLRQVAAAGEWLLLRLEP